MITITRLGNGIDPATYSADLFLRTTEEYPAAYQRITNAIYANVDLQVVVLNARASSWLKTLADRYGSERVIYQVVDVHNLLEKRLRLEIPQDVTDQEIISSGLLELSIPAAGQTDFYAYLQEVFFGSFMTKPGAIYRVSEILAAYEPEQWRSALNRPLVRKAYLDWFRIQRRGIEAAHQKGELQLLAWLEKSPEVYFRNLSALKLLANYPVRLGEHALGSHYAEVLVLGLDLRKVPIVYSDLNVIDEIRIYLNSLVTQPSEDTLVLLLEQVSGLLEIELEALIDVLKSNQVQVTPILVQRIQHRFRSMRDQPQIAQILDDLEQLVTIPAPSEPVSNWSVDEWLSWSTQEYLPYRFWLENTNRLGDEIGELAGKYADWLFANYNQLRYNSERMAWRAMHRLGEKIKQHTGPVLVVMVDNFNLKFYPLLQRRLQAFGYLEQEYQHCISMLPSYTEISKKCIFVGTYKPDLQSTGYALLIEESWAKRIGKRVRYLANIIELRDIAERTADVYFLNYLPIDFALHQSDSHTGISHNRIVREYLNTLANDIHGFARRLGAERDLMLIITSDHGSTRIPRGTINVIDHNFYRKHARDEHHRFITINREEIDKLPDKIQYECYLFRGEEFDLPDNYLVARRLYRFLATDDSVYTHGGLTPEETIVPVAVYVPSLITPRQIDIKVIQPKKIIVGTRLDLVLELTNFNNYPLERVELVIDDYNLEADPVYIPEIGKLQRSEVKIKSRCLNNADITATKLMVQVTFEFVGQIHGQSIEVPVHYDSLVKTKFDLDNL